MVLLIYRWYCYNRCYNINIIVIIDGIVNIDNIDGNIDWYWFCLRYFETSSNFYIHPSWLGVIVFNQLPLQPGRQKINPDAQPGSQKMSKISVCCIIISVIISTLNKVMKNFNCQLNEFTLSIKTFYVLRI